MHKILKDKTVVFFDAGYTLIRPASGDWMLTNRFIEVAGDLSEKYSEDTLREAFSAGGRYMSEHHYMPDVENELEVYFRFYGIIFEKLRMEVKEEDIMSVARDHTFNTGNYILYPDVKTVLETLSKTHRLGIISDTSPSIENKLRELGILGYFSFCTYSFALGVCKPDERMYLDALAKCGHDASETVFIDDNPKNLDGAAKFGITPILIAANPDSDVDTEYLKIHALSELL